MKMQVFEAEKNLGLHKMIFANASICYLTPLIPSGRVYTSKASTDNSDPLLYRMTDVLASSGWNLNEDVFDPYELYSARKSPVHKPFDIEHEESNIIGHIVASRCITGSMEDGESDYEELDDNLSLDNIPLRFHVLNDSVIYKTWSDEEKMEATLAMIEEIEKGEWFVSMECKFSGFDYSVINPDGEQVVIPRTEDTAFLTRYLRAYGGDGEYVDKATGSVYRIGRLMKNIIFSGKGLVRKPANPESVIINQSENVQASENKVYVTTVDVTSNSDKENNMSDELKELQSANEKLVSQIASLTTELTSVKASQTNEKLVAQETTIDQLNTQLASVKESLDKTAKANDEISQKLADAEKQLADVRAEKKKMDRVKKVKDAGADDEDVESTVSKFDNLTDDQFDSLVDTLAKTWKASKNAASTQASTEAETDTAKAGKNLVDNARRDDEVALVVMAGSKLESARSSIAERMSKIIKNK